MGILQCVIAYRTFNAPYCHRVVDIFSIAIGLTKDRTYPVGYGGDGVELQHYACRFFVVAVLDLAQIGGYAVLAGQWPEQGYSLRGAAPKME